MARQATPTRRKPNTGAIREKCGRDLPWEAAFPIGHGQYRYDAFATRPEAEAHLDRLVKERDHEDSPRDIGLGSQRFDAFMTMWLDTKKGRIKDKTWANYRYMAELAVGQWKTRRMDSIHRPDADTLLSYFGRRGFRNVKHLRAMLRQAFEYAVDIDAIRKNPFKGVKAPTMEHRKAVALTKKQRTHMLDVAAQTDSALTPLLPAWHLLSRVGFRRGETLALRWCDIDWDEGTITIAQQYTDVNGVVQKSTPKSKRSARTVPIPEDLLEILKQHRDRQRLIRARAEKWEDLDLVFCHPNGQFIHPLQIHRRWVRLHKVAGLPIGVTIHGLRHTAAYLLEKQGVPPSARMALLGHSTVHMATHYSDHADMDAMRDATKKMG